MLGLIFSPPLLKTKRLLQFESDLSPNFVFYCMTALMRSKVSRAPIYLEGISDPQCSSIKSSLHKALPVLLICPVFHFSRGEAGEQ